ncbi:MAG: ABC transporter ATP-binding protein [Nitrososphaerota archaeon]|nr:ABC transporter ATP-binding protein [Nitrososphaerales archaeon]MDW8044976.1 ABC transporter ATP-binding protein [Nitrososphaerota archaeon]
MVKFLEVKNVVKRFGGLYALRGVSLEVDKGERVAIIGPNGSGKSTLLNVINGVYKPEAGKVIFEGEDLTDLPPYKRAQKGIARAFQIPRPFHNITVRENVAIGALFGSLMNRVSLKEALEIADDVLKIVGLYDKRSLLASKLTVREKKTLEVARALAMKPKLLLLDEIVAGMPPNSVDEFMDLVLKVTKEENIAVVTLVEHVMRAVVRFAERVIVLHFGEKILEGPPSEVLRDAKLIEIYLGKAIGDTYEKGTRS